MLTRIAPGPSTPKISEAAPRPEVAAREMGQQVDLRTKTATDERHGRDEQPDGHVGA